MPRRTQVIPLPEAAAKGREVARKLKGGEVFALTGPLGAGKTTFVRALAKGLGVRHRVTSPTFVIMNRYRGRLRGAAGSKPVLLYHLDLYRTRSFKEVTALGLDEIWGKADTVTAIEWADRIRKHLPKNTHVFTFRHQIGRAAGRARPAALRAPAR